MNKQFDPTELDAVEDEWSRAIVANDADRIAAFMTADWVIVSDAGITSAVDFLSAIRSGNLTHSAMTRVGASRVRAAGDSAIVTARTTSTARFAGQEMDADEWVTDVFVRDGSSWRCVLTHITAVAGH